MKKYIVEISEKAISDLKNIISYLRDDLEEDIIADKYKILFKQKINSLENIAGSMPVLDKELTGHENIRKVNVRNNDVAIFNLINGSVYRKILFIMEESYGQV